MPLYINTTKFQEKKIQEESLKVGWHENQDSSMVEPQARDLEVRVIVPVQVNIFLLKFINRKKLITK